MSERKRFIDANALIQKHGSDVTNWDKPYAVKISSIENAPTVDAVEVVHGRWITDIENDEVCGEMCSVCCSYKITRTNYCPNCGAKMDAESKVVDFDQFNKMDGDSQ
jgi:hypothetical protein